MDAIMAFQAGKIGGETKSLVNPLVNHVCSYFGVLYIVPSMRGVMPEKAQICATSEYVKVADSILSNQIILSILDNLISFVRIETYEKRKQTNLLLLLSPIRLRDWFVFNNTEYKTNLLNRDFLLIIKYENNFRAHRRYAVSKNRK